jgi:hypothetical protein
MRKQTDSATEEAWKWLVGAIIEAVAYDENGIISIRLKHPNPPWRSDLWLTAQEKEKDVYEGSKRVALRLVVS